MSNTEKKEIFRKERPVPKKNRLYTFLAALLMFFVDVFIFFACLWARMLSVGLPLSILFPYTPLIISGLALVFFALLLVVSACGLTHEPLYLLIKSDSTLLYEDEVNRIVIQLPCSVERTPTTILLDDNIKKLVLYYDETEDTELLDFLKDILG